MQFFYQILSFFRMETGCKQQKLYHFFIFISEDKVSKIVNALDFLLLLSPVASIWVRFSMWGSAARSGQL